MTDSIDLQGAELRSFLDYSAVFLGNIGNYYGHGDQKFVPDWSATFLKRLSETSHRAQTLYNEIEHEILAEHPSSLGFPSSVAQSAYYLGEPAIGRNEVATLSQTLEQHSIEPENTRLKKTVAAGQTIYEILQASVERDLRSQRLDASGQIQIDLARGDHSRDLDCICNCLQEARRWAANDRQKDTIDHYLESFRTGSMCAYKESQRIWVKDVQPSVEAVLGFIEPYRDPYGIRAEFEGLAAVVHKEETKKLTELVEIADTYIRRLPWAAGSIENDGKGPFEKDLFENPDFTSLHSKQ